MHLLFSSVQFEKIWGEAGTKGLGRGGSIRYVLNESQPMASTRVTRVIYLPRLVQTGRQVDCHYTSIVLTSLIVTNFVLLFLKLFFDFEVNRNL